MMIMSMIMSILMMMTMVVMHSLLLLLLLLELSWLVGFVLQSVLRQKSDRSEKKREMRERETVCVCEAAREAKRIDEKEKSRGSFIMLVAAVYSRVVVALLR